LASFFVNKQVFLAPYLFLHHIPPPSVEAFDSSLPPKVVGKSEERRDEKMKKDTIHSVVTSYS